MAGHMHVEGVNQWAFLWPRCSCRLSTGSVECKIYSFTSEALESLVERAEFYGFIFS